MRSMEVSGGKRQVVGEFHRADYGGWRWRVESGKVDVLTL